MSLIRVPLVLRASCKLFLLRLISHSYSTPLLLAVEGDTYPVESYADEASYHKYTGVLYIWIYSTDFNATNIMPSSTV